MIAVPPNHESVRVGHGEQRRPIRRAVSLRLTAEDTESSFGFQVGDALSFTATVRGQSGTRVNGTVNFTSNNGYEAGCRNVRVQRGAAVCYLTFYSPNRFHVTARYVGRDRATTSVTLYFSVVPSTDD